MSKFNKIKIQNKNYVARNVNNDEDVVDILINYFKNLYSKLKQKNNKNKIKLNISKKLIFTIFIILIILIFLGVVFYFNIKEQIKSNKKPELISFWQPQYKGQSGMPVFRDHQYIIDNVAKEIKIHKKLDGTLLEVITVNFIPIGLVETSNGLILIKSEGSDNLYFFENKKLTKVLSLPGFNISPNFSIDSKDNIYYADIAQAKILKYDLEGNKLLEISGYGKAKDKFQKIGRIFLDKDDNLYVYDNVSPVKIKVFTSEGKFIKEINTKMKELKGWESIVITHDGNIYINDLFELVIRVYSPTGKLLGKFNSDATNQVGIGIPNCLSGGIDNIIYVHTQAFRPIKY